MARSSWLALLALLGARAQESRPDPEVTRAELEATIGFLASDALAGRVTGSPEAMRAAAFLAEALGTAGLEPGGDDGTFLQAVPLTSTVFDAPPRLEAWRPTAAVTTPSTFVHGIDFDLRGLPPEGELRVLCPATADEIPPPARELALFLDGELGGRRGPLGEGRGAGFGLILVAASEKPGESATIPRTIRGLAGDASRPATLRARGALLAELRAGLVERLRIEGHATTRTEPAANVVGLVRGVGTDQAPELAHEAVVISAHYDHIPAATGRAPGEDTIMNGADDDASGCAAVVELAQALASGARPARTLIFLLATGEEIGLVGTDWYVAHPLVPLERTVCNLNFEMIGRPDPMAGGSGRLWLTGDERSNLGDAFRALGLAVVPDPRPSEHFFERSDNIAFARLGIVAQTLSSYNMHADYHGPDDELERLDLAHMEAAVRAGLVAARALADGSLSPAWKPGGDPSRH